MKSLAKPIYLLILAGILFNLVKLYFAQMDYEALAQDGVFPWYFKLGFFGNIFISLASVLCFINYRKYFPNYVSICYILIIVFVLVASGSDVTVYQEKPSFFYSIKGAGTFLNFGILFFVADTRYFPQLLKWFYYMSFVLILAAFISLAKMGLGSTRKQFLDAVRMFLVYLIWVFPYFFLQEEKDKKKNLINIIAFLAIFIIILASGSRSYLIIYFIFIAVKFREQLRSKNAIVVILAAVVLAVGGYFILINSGFSQTIDNALDNLSERSGEDTRSEQILDFLSQYDTDYLIQGVGPLKQWFWHSINSWYDFLDNQILLIAWWAGLPTILTYVFFLIRTLFEKSEILLFEDIRGTKLMIGLWFAACLGFAIYVTVCCDLYYYFISLMIGLTVCKYSQIIEPEPTTETEDD